MKLSTRNLTITLLLQVWGGRNSSIWGPYSTDEFDPCEKVTFETVLYFRKLILLYKKFSLSPITGTFGVYRKSGYTL